MSQISFAQAKAGGFSSGFANCRFQTETELDLLKRAEELLAKHQFAAAFDRYSTLIRLNPEHAPAHLGSAICAWNLGQDTRTGDYLHEAIRLDPSFAKAHATLAMWYLIHGLSEAAERSSAAACELSPTDAEVLTTRGNILEQSGDAEGVCRLLRQIEELGAPTPAFAILNARMARRRGSVTSAVDIIFSVLNTGRCTTLEASALHLAASNLLDGMGQFDRAFDQAQRGNSIRQVGWNPSEVISLVDRNIRYFTREKLDGLVKTTETSQVPVFVLGFVRSGTSLVSKSSHPIRKSMAAARWIFFTTPRVPR